VAFRGPNVRCPRVIVGTRRALRPFMPTTEPNPWSVRPTSFPEGGATHEKLLFCVRYALLAPSSHNTQPWFFAVRDQVIDVFADRLRALPVVDPEDRELTISCGAALETLVVAMGRFGIRYDVELVRDRKTPDQVARVHVLGFGAESPDPLFDAITERHTSRVAYAEDSVSRETVLAIESEVRSEDTWFRKVPGLEERIAVANLVDEGDRIQMADRRFRRELAQWVHANRSSLRDGLPGYALGLSDSVSTLEPLVLRTFDVGGSQAAKDRELALKSPLLGVIGTGGDGTRDWITAGRALARVLLRVTAEGLRASFLNQPIEVPELRHRLASTVGRTGFPQLLLRFGKAPPARPTPRRALEDVLAR
jgi:hypothetical protein